MKKIIVLLLLIIVFDLSTAFADVVDITMGSYNLLGARIPFTMVMILVFFFVLIFAYIAIKNICKTEKSKAVKILFSILTIILALGFFVVIPMVLPSPSYNHGMRVGPTSSVSIDAYNSIYKMFVGTNRSYSEARALIMRINAHNLNMQESSDYGTINIIPEDIDINSIKNANRYNIEIIEYNDMGAVKTIEIIEQ